MDTLNMRPTVGRTVHYMLSEGDAAEINGRRYAVSNAAAREDNTGFVVHTGNDAAAGDVLPMLIVKVWGDTAEAAVNGQVVLDGNDSYWATSRIQGDGPGMWSWPPRV